MGLALHGHEAGGSFFHAPSECSGSRQNSVGVAGGLHPLPGGAPLVSPPLQSPPPQLLAVPGATTQGLRLAFAQGLPACAFPFQPSGKKIK